MSAVPDADAIDIQVHRLDPDLPLPGYANPGDAGLDLHARVDITLEPGERALVPTGLAIALPDGTAGFVHPRSGLAHRHGITIVNAPGTVDAGYRGEIQVNLLNTDRHTAFTVRRGDRIAQLVVQRVLHARLVEVDRPEALGETVRGVGGHGASGGFSGGAPGTAGRGNLSTTPSIDDTDE